MPAPTRAAAAAKKQEEEQIVAPPSEKDVATGIILRQYKKADGTFDTDRLFAESKSALTEAEYKALVNNLSASILRELQPLGIIEMTLAPWHRGGVKGKFVTGCTVLGATLVVGLFVEAFFYAVDVPGARPSTYIARLFV